MAIGDLKDILHKIGGVGNERRKVSAGGCARLAQGAELSWFIVTDAMSVLDTN